MQGRCKSLRPSLSLDTSAEPRASFLGRVRDAVIRLRQSAVPNDNLATILAEIEVLDALLPSLADGSDCRS